MYTIIIPTHERQNVLMRSIAYYKNFDCDIIIADSSIKKYSSPLPSNVKYRHLPQLSFSRKILEVSREVETSYVCLCADDDYLIQSSLVTGAKFLESEKDFVSVQGRYFKLELVGQEVVFTQRYGNKQSNYFIEEENYLARIIKAYNPYMHHVYSMHRTDIFIKSFRSCADISRLLLVELASIIVPMCYGKHRVLPILWMVRDSHQFGRPDSYQKAPPKKKYNSIFYYLQRCNHTIEEVDYFLASEESQMFNKNLSISISDLISDRNESDELLQKGIKSFVGYLLSCRTMDTLKMIIKAIIPSWIINRRASIKEMNFVKENANNSSLNDELNKIKLSVLDFRACYEKKP